MKRGMALLLALVLILGAFPAAVFAAGGTLTGAGTEASPYEIADADDLMAFAALVNDEGQTRIFGVLTDHIDLTGYDWIPIGSTQKKPYSGTFDGRGYSVRLDAKIDADWGNDCSGLFNTLKNATVRNIRMEGKVTSEEGMGLYLSMGSVAAFLDKNNTIENCSSSVEYAVGDTTVGVGGIVGYVYDSGNEIIACANHGEITGTCEDDQNGYGGIVGWTDYDITLKYCYNSAAIHAPGDMGYAGGLIGIAYGTPTLIGCYTSASTEDNDYLNPRWAERTAMITSDYAAGDFFGTASDISDDLMHNMTYSETIEGECGLNPYEYGDGDQIRRAWDHSDRIDDALEYLNGGETYYTASDEIGDGWPVLAWELEAPASQNTPQEKALAAAKKAFDDEKNAALTALDNGKTIGSTKYVGYTTYKYRQDNTYTNPVTNDYYRYNSENWALLEGYYRTARQELKDRAYVAPEDFESMEAEDITADGARQQTEARLTVTSDEALLNMAEVLTISRQKDFDGKKLTAQRDYYTAYIKQLYALDTDRGMLSAVWHELTGTAPGELETLAEKLDETLGAGLEALGATRTQKQLDAVRAEWSGKLLAVRKDYTVPEFDSGVADKWDGTTKTQPAGSGTKADPYQIGTGAELAWFADRVNSGSLAACAVLTADIDLNRQEWTAIATDKYNRYTGTFDGQGHIIHGLWSTAEGQQVQGLFGYIGHKTNDRASCAVIQNVRIAGHIRAVQSNGSGMIAGDSEGMIYNCEVSAFLGTWQGISSVGGIVGDLKGGSVENCRTYGLYLATDDSKYSGNMVNSIGGIAGSAGAGEPRDGALIRYCENDLRLRGYEMSYLSGKASGVGGIVGVVYGTAKVRESVNRAEVFGGLRVGGIVGNVNANGSLDMAYVTNYGDVYGSDGNTDVRGTGGITGISADTASLSLRYAYNAGTIYSEAHRNKYNSAYDYSTAAGSTGAIIGNWRAGDVEHVQSCSADNTLWGYAAATGADSTDAIRTDRITPEVNAGGGMWEKLTATRGLLDQLIHIGSSRDTRYPVYGTQSRLFNDTVMQCVRKVELCTTAEEIEAALREAEAALSAVPTELEAAKAALRGEMQAFADGNLYDAENQKAVDAVLAEADAALEAAKTLADVTDVRQTYLGSENIDGRLKEIATYPVKAANALYNEFIYGKNYTRQDTALLLRAYESQKLKLDRAKTVEEVESLYAEARKALTELVSDFTEGSTAPDADQAAQDALALARREILDELSALEKKYADALTEQAGDLTALAEKWQNAVQSLLDESRAALHTAAAPALDGIVSYAELDALRQSAMQELDALCAAARRKLAVLLASADNINAWDGETKAQPTGKGTEAEPYRIGTGAELAWLADKVNGGNSGSLYAVLTADIDLGFCEWTPIGRKVGYSNGAYRGTFDGQGHTVSGLYISSADTGYVGLFGRGFVGTKLRDLTVRGEISLTDVTSDIVVGGIIADSTSAVFENCVSDVQISVTFNDLGGRGSSLGGFAGLASSGTFTDCRFEGSITCLYQYSSYLGFSDGGLGGIVGYLKNGRLERCANVGDVTANKASGVGGIAGRIYAYNDEETALHECLNAGHISNDVNFVIGVGEWPVGGIGGIAGVVQSGRITIDTCYNTGVISGGIIAGGILGGESGKYGKTASTGNPLLTVKNCYNAGVLDTGTKIDHIGTLVGFPIDGQYRDNLYVLSGTARSAMGWKSSQGDRVYTADTLTADMFDGLIDSIAGLNGSFPVFPWQLLTSDSRETVITYLNDLYRTKAEPLISDTQRAALTAMLSQTADTVRTTDDVLTLLEAYHAALAAMEPEKLLDEARAAALQTLTRLYETAKTAYSAIETALTARYDADRVAVAQSANAAQAEAVIDSFAANTVDLLVADAQGAPLRELTSRAEAIEAAYTALTAAQQSLVLNYAALTDIKALAVLYSSDLALLTQWNEEDKTAYPDLAQALTALGAEAQTALGACTGREELSPVLDGYCADVVRLLLGDIGFTAGTTTMGGLADAADRLERARKALDALAETQKSLLGEEAGASLADAEALLAVYNKAIETLEAWLQEDTAKYPQIASALQALADGTAAELRSCTDRNGAILALERHCADVAGALIDAAGFVPGKTAMAAVDGDAVKTARAAYNALTDAQRTLVSESALQTLEAAEKLLTDYRRAADELGQQSAKDQTRYSALADRIGALTAQRAAELNACISAEEAQQVIDRYNAQVADLLIGQIDPLPQKPTEEFLEELGRTLRRAQEHYRALTDAQKQYVTRLEELRAAEEYYRTAEAEKPAQPQTPETEESSDQPAPSEPSEPQPNSDAVKAVSDLIRGIGEVTLERREAIEAALDAFNALTDGEKALLPAGDKAALDTAVAAYQALLDAQTPTEPSKQPDGQKPAEESKGFDWRIVWLTAGILGAAAMIFGLVRWFLAAKRAKEK